MANSTKTILLVEDEVIIALQETIQLQKAGYTVIHSLTGENAIDIVNTNPDGIALILMDIDLGKGIYGTEAAEQILRTNDIPVLFLSSHMEPEIVKKTEEITNYGYVVKSSVFTVLDASIKMALRLFAAKRQLDLDSMEIKEKNKELTTSLERLQKTNQLLELSEDKFSKASQENPDSITLTRISDGVIIDVNQGFTQMTGYAYQEAVGRSALPDDLGILVHPERRERLVQELSEKGEIADFETVFRRKDGKRFLGSLSAHTIEIGREKCIISTTRDISEQKHISEIEQESESKYRILFDDAGADILISDYETHILDANKKCLTMLGYSKKELLSMTIRQIDPEQVERSLIEKRIDTIQKSGSLTHRAYRTRKNGSSFPLEVNAVAIVWEGKPAIMSISRDITDLLETEEQLKKSRERFELAMEATADGVWDHDFISNTIYYSPSYYHIVGYTVAEIGKADQWENYLHPDDRNRVLSITRDCVENRRNGFDMEYRFKVKDGSWKWLRARAKAISRDATGYATRMVGTCADITEAKKSEETLKESEERFRLAMEATTDGLWDNDLLNNSYYYSPAYYRILGYNAADFPQALTWQEFIHPEDREYVLTINQDCIENQRQNFEAQYRVKTKDGIWKWIHCRGKVVSRDSTGKATRMVGTIIDITERVRSEETLRESESKWKSMISASPDGICVVSIDGDIQFASEKCASMLGYDDPDISIGHSIFDYLDTSSQNKAKLYMREIFTGRETHSEEYVLRRKDGSFLYAELNSQVLSDKDNKPNQLMVIIRDITDRKKKEEELAESQQRYFDLLNSMREGFAYVDEADIYRLVNPSFDQIMGQPMIGKSIYDVPDNKGKKILMNESGRRKKGGSSEYVVSIIRPDGQRRWIRVNSSPLYGNDGRYIGRSALHRDITDELKEKAELNQLVKTKETLMKELQHRVKNSLTLVSSLLDIAMNGISDTKAIGVLEDTISRIQSMSAIYERLYLTESVSSIHFGTYVDGIAKSIFNTFSPDSSKIKLSVEAEQIDIDTKRAISLGLIVNELLTNALKYAFPYNRSGVITVSFEKIEQDVSLTVSDDGVGMKDPAILDSSPTMGMTLIRLLASQIGASMKVDLSHGTSISIVFKL